MRKGEARKGETIISHLAEWLCSLKYEQIPPRVRKKALLQLYSVLGAICASARHEIGKLIAEAVASWRSTGPASLLPTGEKTDLLSAVYHNAALSMALDYDDYLLFGHTGHSTVCVSLAVGEMTGRSWKDALTAQVIANELAGRLGAAVVLGPHNGQAWSHIHLLGAAGAAAKLLNLSPDQSAHALAIALYQPPYVLFPGFMGPDSKATTAATPAVTGLQAALLAAHGATGPLDIIEHPQGFLARFSHVPAPFFFSGLGRAWTTDTLAYKIYPGCAYIDTTVDAVLHLREKYEDETGQPLLPGEVEEVVVEATILTVEMDRLSRTAGAFDPLNPVSVNFSIPGNVALALLHGRLAAEDLSRSSLQENASAILQLSEKVRLVHDWSLTLTFLEAIDQVLNLRQLAAQFPVGELIAARRRIQEQYQISMALSWPELKQLWRQAPELRGRLWGELKSRLTSLGAASARQKSRQPYDLGERPLHKFSMPFAARVTIRLMDGRILTHRQDIPAGGAGSPFDKTRENVIYKLQKEAAPLVPEKKIEELITLTEAEEEKLSVGRVVELASSGEV